MTLMRDDMEAAMRFSCMNCEARYEIPDERIRAAGSAGLRIRCRSCRAVMAVSAKMVSALELSSSNSVSRNQSFGGGDLENSVSSSGISPFRAAIAATPISVAEEEVSIPSINPLSGRRSEGGRDVSGAFVPQTAQVPTDAVWHAAIARQVRGPFTTAELKKLADQGKVRRGTLLWHPDWPSWRSLKMHQDSEKDGQIIDDVYVASFWHDIGKIIVACKRRELLQRHAGKRGKESNTDDELSSRSLQSMQYGKSAPPPPPVDEEEKAPTDAFELGALGQEDHMPTPSVPLNLENSHSVSGRMTLRDSLNNSLSQSLDRVLGKRPEAAKSGMGVWLIGVVIVAALAGLTWLLQS